jgi:hypothetical protein
MLSKSCVTCGRVFYKPVTCSQLDWTNERKNCSQACNKKWRKGIHFSPATQFSKTRHYVPPTAIKPGQHLSPATQFTSEKSLGNKQRLGLAPWNKGKPHLQKEKHWNWKGGISRFRDVIKSSPEYRAWREAVFTRDDYTCQFCGIRGGYLEVHHFFRFAHFPEFRTHEPNGITLCRPCHDTTRQKDRISQLVPLLNS